jgi:hypothetical protein
VKPRYRLHFNLFEGKTPLWWVTRQYSFDRGATTGGYVDPANAIREAARL